jgi:hypothetical protein
MTSLYEIRSKYIELQNLDLEPELLKDTLESLEDSFTDKAENIVMVIKDNESIISAIDTEIKRLQDRKSKFAKRNDSLKEYLMGSMIAMDHKSVKSNLFNISIKKNPPSVEIFDEGMIPEQFVKVEEVRKIDKKLISSELKAGMVVAGAVLKQGQSLTIK